VRYKGHLPDSGQQCSNVPLQEVSEESEGEEVNDFHEGDTVSYNPPAGSEHTPISKAKITLGPENGLWMISPGPGGSPGWVPDSTLTLVTCPHKKPKVKKTKKESKQLSKERIEELSKTDSGRKPTERSSVDALLALEESGGKLTKKEMCILILVDNPEGLNSMEISVEAVKRFSGGSHSGELGRSISPRPAELYGEGILNRAGRRKCSVTNQENNKGEGSIVWVLAPEGSPPRLVSKPDARDKVFDLLEALFDRYRAAVPDDESELVKKVGESIDKEILARMRRRGENV